MSSSLSLCLCLSLSLSLCFSLSLSQDVTWWPGSGLGISCFFTPPPPPPPLPPPPVQRHGGRREQRLMGDGAIVVHEASGPNRKEAGLKKWTRLLVRRHDLSLFSRPVFDSCQETWFSLCLLTSQDLTTYNDGTQVMVMGLVYNHVHWRSEIRKTSSIIIKSLVPRPNTGAVIDTMWTEQHNYFLFKMVWNHLVIRDHL